jgi:Outer membrane protein beta-barrel domain
MKKTLTILSAVLVLLISFNAKAQDDKPQAKSYIGFLGGLSLPAGNFGQSVYSNNSAGFAKKGVTLGLDAGIYLYKNLGLGLTFSFQDQGELSTNDAQNLSNGYGASFQRDQTTVTAVNRYHNYNLMGGPQYSFIIKKFTLDLRASAGIIKSVSTPNITVDFDTSSSNALTLNQLNSTGVAFAYGGSAGLRYSFSDNWDVGIRANYVTSDGINISNTGHLDNTTGRIVTKQPITELQTTLGITLHL